MVPEKPKDSQRRLETTPIFVLGLQRSGTTWLANMLCRHASCIGIQSEDHQGIHESVYFSHFSRSYGNLSDEESYSRFVRHFSQSDFFLLSDVSPSWFSEFSDRGYATIFHGLMEHVALRGGATHWVEKSPHHSLHCYELAELYPNAKFVCILRDSKTLIPSLLSAPWRPRTPYPLRALAILRTCMTYTLYTKHLVQFAEKMPNAKLVRYEELTENTEKELTRLCDFLDLPYQAEMVDVPFKRNTSFRTNEERSICTSALDMLLVRLFLSIMWLVPHRLLYWANKLKVAIRPEPWPDWVWRRCPLGEKPPAVNA